jgi:hypothetical protein
MSDATNRDPGGLLPRFDRHFFDGKQQFTQIGDGSIGGKAHGLARMKDVLADYCAARPIPSVAICIPTLTVIATDMFDAFIEQNDLADIAFSQLRDDQIALAFQQARLPAELVGDLRSLMTQIHTPLAVRSSSFLEDAMYQPFASVYTTKMLPNNQHDTDTRFHKLVEAVKFVYASTFFHGAKNYMQATTHTTAEEKMAVIIQAVVGRRHGDRFYPEISGVVRSYNFYPVGHAKPEDGVIDLALGLGKSIVDDGRAWTYSPARPRTYPPYNSPRDLINQTQSEFWAVNMGRPPAYDPIRETEYLNKYGLAEAEADGVLTHLVSTYDAQNDRLEVGMDIRGPRIVTFAPILDYELVKLNEACKALLHICETEVGGPVEIELAATLDPEHGTPAYLGFLQVRPMVVSQEKVELEPALFDGEEVMLSSEHVLGNGILHTVRDVVYLKPETFSTQQTLLMARQIEEINRKLVGQHRPYLLLGFGRWATSDPSYGVPVDFGQISGARVIVETTLPEMYVTLSQGSHFFHNMTSFQIMYFSVPHHERHLIDWDWLKLQPPQAETEYVRWITLDRPLDIRVDGRTGRGVIRR